MTYSEALQFLESRRTLGIKPGLERMKALLGMFSSPQQGLPCIHVAGSNGKGSTANFLTAILSEQGYRVGQFSSPFFSSPCEMFRIGTEPIETHEFAKLAEEASGYCLVLDKTMDQGPTEYEIYTCLALTYFKRSGCDMAVIEACMGGRFDCTNILENVIVCIITKLSLEHQSFLGGTLKEIAWHKAGILKEKVPVITYPQAEEAMEVIQKEAGLKKAPLYTASLEGLRIEKLSKEGIRFAYEAFHQLELCTPALYQTENAALAVLSCKVIREQGILLSESSVKNGLANTVWPGRFEFLHRDPDFILDCCHNPDGVEAFIRSYRAIYGEKKAVILLGVMRDKDYHTMLKSLSKITYALIAIEADTPRALSAEILKEAAANTCDFVHKSDTIREAVTKSLKLIDKEGVICALGSHFHANSVKKALLLEDFGGLLC